PLSTWCSACPARAREKGSDPISCGFGTNLWLVRLAREKGPDPISCGFGTNLWLVRLAREMGSDPFSCGFGTNLWLVRLAREKGSDPILVRLRDKFLGLRARRAALHDHEVLEACG